MKYSYRLISEYLSEKILPGEMIEYLDLLGLNPLVVSETQDDVIFELETPANRGYLLSLVGVARELIPFTRCSLKLPEDSFPQDNDNGMDVRIEDGDDCSYYSCRIIRNIRNIASPWKMKEALGSLGYRTSFHAVDVSNFVMAETGQPLHIFDLDTIDGHVEIRRGRKGESAVLIDGRKREIDRDNLVIADSSKIIAVAGIMGCEVSEVKEHTRNILIESAVFNPVVVRRSSKKLGLSTEASLRFERGMDIETASKGMARTSCLIKEVSGGESGRLVEEGITRKEHAEILLRAGKVSKVLGIEVPETSISDILSKLGFSVSVKGKGLYGVIPPVYRNDIGEDIDLVEEIARYGRYSEIPSLMPEAGILPTPSSEEIEKVERIKDVAVKLGFTEFVNMGLAGGMKVETEKPGFRVAIENPISENLGFLRMSLVPEMLESVRHNVHHGTRQLEVFEAGKIFRVKDKVILEENGMLFATVNLGDFFLLKGKIERFLGECGIGKPSFVSRECFFADQGHNTAIFKSGKESVELGNIFIPSNRVKKSYGLESEEIYLCEIFLDRLIDSADFRRSFEELPRYPSSRRDFSFIFSEDVQWNDIEEEVLSLGLPVEGVEFFDAYRDKKMESGSISISFSVVFRHPEKTLESSEIKEFASRIAEEIKLRFKGRLRGEDSNN